MSDSHNEIIENSKQIRSNNIKLQSDLLASIKNAQENYAWASAKGTECQNLSSTNKKLLKNIDVFTQTLAEKELEIKRLHENEVSFNCNICDAYFRLEESLKRHKESVHVVLFEVLVNNNTELEIPASENVIETLQSESFQESAAKSGNQHETEIFHNQTGTDVEKHFQSQAHDNDSRTPEKGSIAYRKLVEECMQNGAKCIITKYDAKGQPKVDKRKSIIGPKSILSKKGI